MNKLINILLISFFVLFFIGCEKKVEYIEVNHTFTEVINNTIECIKSECVCKCEVPTAKDCKTTVCDNSLLSKCRMDSARAMAEASYYKNLSITHIIRNNTIEDIEENLSRCMDDVEELEEKLKKIKEI